MVKFFCVSFAKPTLATLVNVKYKKEILRNIKIRMRKPVTNVVNYAFWTPKMVTEILNWLVMSVRPFSR